MKKNMEKKPRRGARIQRIDMRWAKEWKEYRYVTPKYMKKFVVKPPCPRPPLAAGQRADPTSIRHGEEFPREWAKQQAKLNKMVAEALRKFNEDSQAAAAEASASRTAPKKAMQKKSAVKPRSSSSMPSRPSSSTVKCSEQIPQTTSSRAAQVPSVAAKSSAAATKSSTPVHLATCQWTAGFSIASGASATSLAHPHSSSGPTLLKVKATAGRGKRASPHKKQVVFREPSDDDELSKIIRDRQQKVARAKGSIVPLMLDPRKILDFIDLWQKDPNTPLPDLNLTPGQSHMLNAFIGEEKWKFEKARKVKKD
jgi:hypothetical protein